MTATQFIFRHLRLLGWPGLAVVSALVMTGCSEGGAEDPPADIAMPVVIQKPELTKVNDTIAAVGTVEANEQVDVQPEVSGLIEDIRFEEGDHVEQGQPLFLLNSRAAAATVAQAEAELRLAQANSDRAEKLIGTRAISLQELDQLKSLVDVKSAALKTARERLDERSIEAPFDGRVGPRRVSPGQYVEAGTTLVTLVDDSTMKVDFRIPERQLAQLKKGQEVQLSVAAYPDRAFQGKVDLIDPVVDQGTRTVGIRCVAPNAERLLQPGMFARVSVVVQTRDQALVIPEAALVPSLDAISVYRVEDGVAKLTPITLGVRLPGHVEVLSGLTADSEFVASGLQKIVDGMKVIPAPGSTNAPAAAL